MKTLLFEEKQGSETAVVVLHMKVYRMFILM